jgi:DNA-directed RNA polymerase subunit M/transcription elongation factor TFIIS
MQIDGASYICPKCGEEIETPTIEVRRDNKPPAKSIYVVEDPMERGPVVSQQCPRCDNTEAYRSILASQGDHAGVKQDRTVERYTCTKCSHTWLRT